LKRETIADLDIVKEYYNISTEKAKEALTILTEDQLNIIKKKLDKGGSDVRFKRTD
jgi:chemotaxis protein CheY-P-specific phosphatase CheC